MDTVLVALLVMTIILVGSVTLMAGWTASQHMTAEAWEDMESRAGERLATGLRIVGATAEPGVLRLTVRNTGDRKLADYAQWDLILQLYTASGQLQVGRVPYVEEAPSGAHWEVAGIFVDASAGTVETYEPDILNPGEELQLVATIEPLLSTTATQVAVLATAGGVSSTFQFVAVP